MLFAYEFKVRKMKMRSETDKTRTWFGPPSVILITGIMKLVTN